MLIITSFLLMHTLYQCVITMNVLISNLLQIHSVETLQVGLPNLLRVLAEKIRFPLIDNYSRFETRRTNK